MCHDSMPIMHKLATQNQPTSPARLCILRPAAALDALPGSPQLRQPQASPSRGNGKAGGVVKQEGGMR